MSKSLMVQGNNSVVDKDDDDAEEEVEEEEEEEEARCRNISFAIFPFSVARYGTSHHSQPTVSERIASSVIDLEIGAT